MSDPDQDELPHALAEARAYLEWELELGGIGYRPTPRARLVDRPSSAGTVRAESRSSAGEVRAVTSSGHVPAATPGDVPNPSRDLERSRITPIAADRRPLDEVRSRLEVLAGEAAACTACKLHAGRTKSVFARGSMTADLVFVGEGPGYNEDQQGEPFVGAAGQLLDKMIAAMGYAPRDVYICNVVKCRPPDNRTPEPDEMRACSPYLAGQLELVRPRAIVALGRCAAEGIGAMTPDGRNWRGSWAKYRGIPVMPTYHPAYLLRSPEQKRVVWADLQKVMALLGQRSIE